MSERIQADTLLLSDTHLGFGEHTAKWLLTILPKYEFRRIIFVGDTFHHYNFSLFSKAELEFLTWLCNLEPDVEVVILPGNHDPNPPATLKLMARCQVQIVTDGQYVWQHKGQSCVALHGDQFDPSLTQDKQYQDFLYWCEKKIRAIDRLVDWFVGRRQVLLSFFFNHPYWKQRLDNLSTKAMEFVKQTGHRFVFCGHVHQPGFLVESSELADDTEILSTYINLGCWIDSDPVLGVIGSNGVELHHYSPAGELIGVVCLAA